MADLTGRNLFSTLDLTQAEVRELVDLALELKAGRKRLDLAGKVLGLLFFNPSVRTRMSSESAIARYGGSAIAVTPGKDTWNFECGEGVVMDGATQEHVRELAPVMSQFCHFVGIRKSELVTTGSSSADVTGSYEEIKKDEFMRAFARFATVPVINLESNSFHPMQGLADSATMVERLGDPRGHKYVLTWAWHPKSLPAATPHSQLLSAANLGMDVTLLRPKGYGLDPEVMGAAKERAEALGGSFEETDDIAEAYRGAHVVCAKGWAGLDYYGRFDQEARDKAPLREDWIVDEAKMNATDDAFFMHCLPVRRNIIVTDGVLDSARSAVVNEAGNRLWTAAAVLGAMQGGG
jgi:N-acetylornithine carbamoyltransferase